MRLNGTSKLAASAVLIVMLSACKTVTAPAPAIDTGLSSWCQGDEIIRYAAADHPNQDDPGNTMDRDKTVAEIQAHNARLRAGCP